MPLYRELRVKWSVFHRLLELTDHRLRYGTQGLPAILQRRRELLLDYSSLLKERGELPYPPNNPMLPNKSPALFSCHWRLADFVAAARVAEQEVMKRMD